MVCCTVLWHYEPQNQTPWGGGGPLSCKVGVSLLQLLHLLPAETGGETSDTPPPLSLSLTQDLLPKWFRVQTP